MVALGVLLAPVSAALHLSHTLAGFAGALPVLCIGLGAPLARWLSRYLAPTRAINASLVLIAAAGLLRAASRGPTMLLLCTAGIGLGIAVASTALPAVVRAEFPLLILAGYGDVLLRAAVRRGRSRSTRRPSCRTLRGMALVAHDHCRSGCGHGGTVDQIRTGGHLRAGRSDSRRNLAEFPSAVWVMAGTFGIYCFVYYGLVTWLPSAYQEFGWSAASASQVVTVVNATSLIGAIFMTVFASRSMRRTSLPTVLACLFALAAVGFVAEPSAAFLWAAMAGLSNGALLPLTSTCRWSPAATPWTPADTPLS